MGVVNKIRGGRLCHQQRTDAAGKICHSATTKNCPQHQQHEIDAAMSFLHWKGLWWWSNGSKPVVALSIVWLGSFGRTHFLYQSHLIPCSTYILRGKGEKAFSTITSSSMKGEKPSYIDQLSSVIHSESDGRNSRSFFYLLLNFLFHGIHWFLSNVLSLWYIYALFHFTTSSS